MVLSESNLDEVEEVTTEQIAPDLPATEADLQLKRAELGMGEPNRVERCGKQATSHRGKGYLGAGQHVEPQPDTDAAVEERPLGSDIENCFDAARLRGIVDVGYDEPQQRA